MLEAKSSRKTQISENHQHRFITTEDKLIMPSPNLDDGDNSNEDRRGTQAVLVEIPTSVRLAGQDLVGHVTDETLIKTQPRLIQEDLPLQCAAAIGDGSSETAGAFAAHLRKG